MMLQLAVVAVSSWIVVSDGSVLEHLEMLIDKPIAILGDLRFAIRSLRRSPGMSLPALEPAEMARQCLRRISVHTPPQENT